MYLVVTKDDCPWCEKAKDLLNSKQIPYTWINLNEMPEMIPVVKAMGLKTVPQIFELLPGGYEGLYAELEMKND